MLLSELGLILTAMVESTETFFCHAFYVAIKDAMSQFAHPHNTQLLIWL